MAAAENAAKTRHRRKSMAKKKTKEHDHSTAEILLTNKFWNRPMAGVLYDRQFKNMVGWYVNESEIRPMIDLVGQCQNQTILDVGCGTGRYLELLNPNNKKFGIDQSNEMLEIARHKIPDAHFQNASAESLPFDSNSFDLVYSVRVLQHIRNQEKAINEMARVCKPSGTLIIVNYNSWSLLNVYKHIRMSWVGKILNIPFKPILGQRSFFGPWGFQYDNYCSVPELSRMMSRNGFQLRHKWGITCGAPWFLNSFFIGKILEMFVPTFFRYFLLGCLWFDKCIGRRNPCKYFLDLILIEGKKIS
jgi:ubiquinone/menaquinone biosynthesis C-methylase UbiE